ncbi:SDR family NAD(P)-dependent oxidoreductase [Ensifer adhaerens]|uniref:SDR family NAD(P)-dependent oxidoreductase n=1 Tax=Ensifer adhaerens TaxID=106592 RepID=UPI001CBB487F|nr:SDR family NAD(P)-dependent oxidoreductase [Ensifer adhaerens]MBZ7924507.1 SDR family NAD(P)-dependent oxidoreductase [Ensifer adhaerens]UAX96253.1 SDR family NAD(P)-dependent oxidoreductase [Ensifer adhaerens]UAY04404.1 SDR family NAD(P)-dependent oxidoreductase [Ensifer adhaerens]UAY09836.1 SDR family NAD(P)-dependent oxidoreductase [Ensifer adhaerens]
MARYVVTGASSGIGREIALQLASKGHSIIALGRDRERLADLELRDRRIQTRALDLRDRAAVIACGTEMMARDTIDGLINNAAIQHNVRFDDPHYDVEQIAAEVETNLLAPMLLSRLLLPNGRPFLIVNVGSALACHPKSTSAVYSATKAGLRMFSDALSVQRQATSVRVVDVVLPLVDTPMTAGRGRGKVSAAYAAKEILRALEGGSRSHVGKARLLRLLEIMAPVAAAAIIRKL